MEWFNRIFSGRREPIEERAVGANIPSPLTLSYANYGTISERNAMLLSVVYRCVDLVSNSVAQLPLNVYTANKDKVDDDLAFILNVEPNDVQDHYTLTKLLVSCMLLRGNAYCIIERAGNKVKALHYMQPDAVSVFIDQDNAGVRRAVYYVINGVAYEADDILHIRNYSYDGIVGVSTLSHAARSIKISADSEQSAAAFFAGGCNLGGILKVQGMMSEAQKKALKESWGAAFNVATGTPKGVAVLEGNMDYQPVTVSPEDAQLLESRIFNVVDLCRFFGVSPTKAYDLSKSSYNTIEAEATGYLSDTIQPILARIESEMQRKLLSSAERRRLSIKYDTTPLLRTDKSSLSNYYRTMWSIGVLSPNEIRSEIDMAPVAGGDGHFIQLNMADLNNMQPINQDGNGNQ